MTNEDWIDVKDKLPTEPGWYKVKINRMDDECEVPYARDGHGCLQWVVPDTSVVTHWKPVQEI